MKLLQTLVSKAGMGELDHNGIRMEGFKHLLRIAADQQADLLILPAGYLTAADESEMQSIFAHVTRLAKQSGIVVALGVDLVEGAKGKGKKLKELFLPYYGCFCGSAVAGPWKQTSNKGSNARQVPEADVPAEGRVVEVAGKRVGMLICGELFSDRARSKFSELRLDLTLDLGHQSMTRVVRSMGNLSRSGRCSVAHCQHVVPSSYAHLHFTNRRGTLQSQPGIDHRYFDDEFWISWTVREV